MVGLREIAKNLHETITNYLQESIWFSSAPFLSLNQIKDWVDEAKSKQRRLKY